MADKKRGNKAYIPWHKRVDEALIKHVAQQFIKQAWLGGFRVRQVNVEWDGEDFNISTHGEPRKAPDPIPLD